MALGATLQKTGSTASTAIPRDRRTWTYQHASAATLATFAGGYDPEHAQSVVAYIIDSDHVQEGRPWIGAGFDSTGKLTDSSINALKRLLTPNPESFTCLTERVDGACANEASITIAPLKPAGEENEDGERQPSKEQSADIADWVRTFSAWWTTVGLWGGVNLRKPSGVKGMVAQASMHKSGSACLRIFFNPASRTLEVPVRNEAGEVTGTEWRIPKQKDRTEALKHIRVVAPPPDRCAVYVDPDTHERTGIFLFRNTENKNCAEVWYADGQETVLRSLVEGADATEDRFPWGGHLPIVQADVGCILTPAVLRIQAALDMFETAKTRLGMAHGYGQRTEINAQRDGKWRKTAPPLDVDEDPETKTAADGVTTLYFWPSEATLANEVIRSLVGIAYTSSITKEGEARTLTTPSVDYHEPSPLVNLLQGADSEIMNMRFACRQGHRSGGLSGSTAEASGEAYEQARASFKNDINGVAESVDACVAEIATVVTIAADWLSGAEEPAFADEWTVQVQSHPSAGSPSTESQRVTLEMVQGELLDAEEGTARLDVQDVAATRARIAQDRTLKAMRERWEIYASATGGGIDKRWFLINEMGYTEEDATAALVTDGPPNIEQ